MISIIGCNRIPVKGYLEIEQNERFYTFYTKIFIEDGKEYHFDFIIVMSYWHTIEGCFKQVEINITEETDCLLKGEVAIIPPIYYESNIILYTHTNYLMIRVWSEDSMYKSNLIELKPQKIDIIFTGE